MLFPPQALTGIVRLFRQGEDKERAQGQSSTARLTCSLENQSQERHTLVELVSPSNEDGV